jgi:hypothetical protein
MLENLICMDQIKTLVFERKSGGEVRNCDLYAMVARDPGALSDYLDTEDLLCPAALSKLNCPDPIVASEIAQDGVLSVNDELLDVSAVHLSG